MDRYQVRFALLKITLLVLFGTTWVFSSFVLATRPEEEAPVDTIGALIRLPASIPSQFNENLVPKVFAPTTKAIQPIEMSVLPVPCWDKRDLSVHETNSRWVRITGQACETDGNAETVTVKNLANGYVATVFQPRQGTMTTDYIPLQPGKNDILVRFETAPGVAVESSFTLVRPL